MIPDVHTILLCAFMVFIAAITLCILREQRRNPLFRATDIITADNGRISSTKFYIAGAFFGTFFWLVDAIALGKADTSAMLAFASIWAGTAMLNKTINNTTNAPATPTTVTTTTEAGSGTSKVTTTVEGSGDGS